MVFHDEALLPSVFDALGNDDYATALELFETNAGLHRTPEAFSHFAYCLARERGDFARATAFCMEAIRKQPGNSLHYLNLGRIHLLAGQKKPALTIFRVGLQYELNSQILSELERMEARKSPPIPFLSRNNPANKFLAIVFDKFGSS